MVPNLIHLLMVSEQEFKKRREENFPRGNLKYIEGNLSIGKLLFFYAGWFQLICTNVAVLDAGIY